MSVIRDLIYRNVRVTFLLLNTNSSHVDTQSQIFVGAGDLKYSIKKSLELLCKEKQNLNIRTYDYFPKHSIIVIDEGHDNAWIKIEANRK